MKTYHCGLTINLKLHAAFDVAASSPAKAKVKIHQHIKAGTFALTWIPQSVNANKKPIDWQEIDYYAFIDSLEQSTPQKK